MVCLLILSLSVGLVISQITPESWIDSDSTPSSISLDSEKVKAFGLRRSKVRCKRDTISRKCGLKCTCIEGRRYCCRQRKDWDALTHDEKTRFLNAVYNIATGRAGWRLRNNFVRLLYIHEEYWVGGIHNRVQFYPWHRIYLLQIENLLRKVDCKLTVPYWDWTKNVARWWESSVFNWRYFGSNLNFDERTGQQQLTTVDQCPSNGYFSPQYGYQDLRGQCLVRQFTYNIVPASYTRIQNILSWKNALRSEADLRHEHGIPHYIVGGERTGLFFTERAAEDPLFWLHHSNVDYQWYQRQTRYLETIFEPWRGRGNIDQSLTAFRETVGQALNPFNHGRPKTCVEYVEYDDRYEDWLRDKRTRASRVGSLSSGTHGYSAASKMECMKSQHSFPARIFTLFKTSPAEMKDFLRNRNEDGDC